MIPDSIIEEIRNRTDVVAVIGRHVELQRSGRTWKGCCPFHGERTPSFHVYPEDKHFKCYGCGEYGDVFKFLQKLEGKEFPEVVRSLAAEVGIEIPEETVEDTVEARRKRKERAEALAACDAAARYWQARLWSPHGEAGRAYLASRGISEEESRRFRLGIAADGWNDLPPRLEQKEISLASIDNAGLRVQSDRGGYDRFRGRLMFPIAAIDGVVIGFGARAMGEEKGAKYINTPETVLYKKSRVLYGLDLARESIRKTRSAVLVEGYFDVIGLHQAGVKNAVAVCGTALTPEHLELLERCDCREVVILFDGDQAGLAAPAKAAQVLLPSAVSGKVAVLPSGAGKVDPDDFARAHGKEGVDALLAAAMPLTDFLIVRAVERHCRGGAPDAPVEAKLAAVRELAPLVRLAPEGLARTTFEERIARRIELDLQALREEIQGRPRAQPPGADAAPPPRRARAARQRAPARAGRGRAGTSWPAIPGLGRRRRRGGPGPPLPGGAARRAGARPLPRPHLPRRAARPARAGRRRPRRGARAGPGRSRRPPRRRGRAGASPRRRRGQARGHPARAVPPAGAGGQGGVPPAEDLTRDQLTLQRRRQDLEKRREELRRP